jgi:hypothetical protein
MMSLYLVVVHVRIAPSDGGITYQAEGAITPGTGAWDLLVVVVVVAVGG